MNSFPWPGAGGRDVEDLLESAEYQSRFLHQHEEALRLVDRAGGRVGQGGANLPARCRIQKAAILSRQGKIAESVRYYREALMMLSGSRDKVILLACLEGLARNLIALGEEETARRNLMEALELALEENDPMAEGRLRRLLGRLAEGNGRLREARSWYKAALKLARQEEDWAGALSDLAQLIDLAEELDRPRERSAGEKERRRLLEELEMLAHLGPSASPRPQVVAGARAKLLPEEPIDSAEDVPSQKVAEDLYQQATALRKDDQHQKALPLYLSALSHVQKLNRPGDLIACLNGLGLCYEMLARGALEEELEALVTASESEILSGGLGSLLRLSYRVLHGTGRELAERARACHRWALELQKEIENLAGQASQVSNLALVEEILGNLDTACRYQRWAMGAHRKIGERAEVAIDMRNLARLERELGDVEAADVWRRRAQEIDREI